MMSLTAAQIGELTAQFFLAAAGTLSFAILFACPRRCLPYCALVGAVGWLWYELLTLLGADAATASLLAVIPLTILTRVFAITQKTPVTVFLLTGIFPLVPGAGTTTPPTISSRTKTPLPLPRASAPLKSPWRLPSASVWCCACRCRRESKTLSVISPCERSEPERVCKAAGFDGSGCPLPKKWQNKGSTLIYVISLKMGICKCRCPFSAY